LYPLPRDGFWTGGAAPEPGEPARCPPGGSRTRFESRVLFRDADEDAEEVVPPCRRFTVLEITSGLADDSRETDEKQVERRLRDLRARVKVARGVVSTTPGADQVLRKDWAKAARFYAKFGITETQFRRGVRAVTIEANGSLEDFRSHSVSPTEADGAQAGAVLPISEVA
jgi:hypothetical protein